MAKKRKFFVVYWEDGKVRSTITKGIDENHVIEWFEITKPTASISSIEVM